MRSYLQHTSAYVSIRQHTSAYAKTRRERAFENQCVHICATSVCGLKLLVYAALSYVNARLKINAFMSVYRARKFMNKQHTITRLFHGIQCIADYHLAFASSVACVCRGRQNMGR
jgi:hypothetical protein